MEILGCGEHAQIGEIKVPIMMFDDLGNRHRWSGVDSAKRNETKRNAKRNAKRNTKLNET